MAYHRGLLKKIKQDAKREAEKRAFAQISGGINVGPGGSYQVGLSKRARKKLALMSGQNQGQVLAIQNGGVADWPRLQNQGHPPPGDFGKGRGKGGKDGKGKGKNGKGNMFEGKPICYNWNRKAACKSQNCTMAHVCLKCHSPDHAAADCPAS